ncbi:MAG: deoxynucleoside kinase [Syntrophobacterales bacterium]|nr:MAG: deoxynucleoside kinase [Syntrophobacterales bacterium]
MIEGPIGVGKTSLAKRLSPPFKARCILEAPEDNPFLHKFYRDRKKYAFQTQLFFLLNRYQQQREIRQIDLFNQVTITDYLFTKDRIFAYLNLDENELALYERVFALLNGRIPTPDLVIFLQAKPETLLARIRVRDIEYEREIDIEYLRALNQAYNTYFFHYEESPLLVVDTSEIDFVNKEEDLENLIRETRSMRRGTWYYKPLGSKNLD